MIKEAHWISEDTDLAAFDKTPNSDITKMSLSCNRLKMLSAWRLFWAFLSPPGYSDCHHSSVTGRQGREDHFLACTCDFSPWPSGYNSVIFRGRKLSRCAQEKLRSFEQGDRAFTRRKVAVSFTGLVGWYKRQKASKLLILFYFLK